MHVGLAPWTQIVEIFLHSNGRTQNQVINNNTDGLFCPKVFTESSNLFGHILEKILE